MTQIEDNSVDFIITDPPYPKEYLPLYEDLSKVAARVLKDGGSLVCMVGQSYLPEVIQLLQTSMTYMNTHRRRNYQRHNIKFCESWAIWLKFLFCGEIHK